MSALNLISRRAGPVMSKRDAGHPTVQAMWWRMFLEALMKALSTPHV